MAGTPTLPEDCPPPPLPVQTAEELKELNCYLGNREKLEMMADYFRQNGGPDYKVAGRTIMSMLVSNSLAKVCSWAGSKGSKEAFADHHNILAHVLAALRPRFPDLDKTTVAAVVKKWIYSASDREGGRNQRRADKANSIE
ncbi:uncharacterized protein LOC144142924 [Haemaphysalis longicornis]